MDRRKFLITGLLAPLGLGLAKFLPAAPATQVLKLRPPIPEVHDALRDSLYQLVGKKCTTRNITSALERTLRDLEMRQTIAQGSVLQVARSQEDPEAVDATVVVRPNCAISYVNISFVVKHA